MILVEGWAEEILIPSFAKAIGIDLTAKGISVVNIGGIGFQHYANIFLRKNPPYMTIPVVIITDTDIRTYEKLTEKIEGKEVTSYVKKDNTVEITQKIAEIKANEYSYSTKSYIFCGIPYSNWSNFKNGYNYSDSRTYGERFHAYIIDYQCSCY